MPIERTTRLRILSSSSTVRLHRFKFSCFFPLFQLKTYTFSHRIFIEIFLCGQRFYDLDIRVLAISFTMHFDCVPYIDVVRRDFMYYVQFRFRSKRNRCYCFYDGCESPASQKQNTKTAQQKKLLTISRPPKKFLLCSCFLMYLNLLQSKPKLEENCPSLGQTEATVNTDKYLRV